jgi:hypothetical protein
MMPALQLATVVDILDTIPTIAQTMMTMTWTQVLVIKVLVIQVSH